MLTYQRSSQWPRKVSAGGAVYRTNASGDREYALLFRKADTHFSPTDSYHLPKGTVEVGETLQQAAAREIKEESGLHVELVQFLTGATLALGSDDGQDYPFITTILYFLAEYQSPTKTGMDHEHDSLVWKGATEAIELLSQIPKQEEKVVVLAEEYFKKVADGSLT